MNSSEVKPDGSTSNCLKSLLENLDVDSFKTLPQETKFLLYAYRRWVAAAQDPCGHLFIHQAFKSPSPPQLESNTPMAI